jgi:hypothetical protein
MRATSQDRHSQMSTEQLELAAWAYQGEVSGEALFAELRDTEPDSRLRAQFETLRLLESQTGALLRGLLERLGGTAKPSDEAREGGQRMAQQARKLSRTALLESFAPGTKAAIAKYERLRMLTDADDRSVVDQVIAHEEALQAFADAAVLGAENPTGPVIALLGEPWLSEIPDQSDAAPSQTD